MYLEYRPRLRAGLRRIQEDGQPLFEKTRNFRIYEQVVIPGLLQTPAYAEAMMRRIIGFHALPDDTEAAVQARLKRQTVLASAERRFAIVVEESALAARMGSADVMAAQLSHMISVALLPNVSLGVIPADVERTVWASAGFWVYDDSLVKVETPSAGLAVTQPREIEIYARMFAELSEMAVRGPGARSLIMAAIDRLGV